MSFQPGDVPGLPRLEDLSPTVRTMLLYGVESFLEGENPPSLDIVKWREAQRNNSFDPTYIYDFPSELGSLGSQGEVEISVGGLKVAEPNSDLIRAFVEVVRVCVRIYLKDGPQARIDCDEVRLHVDPASGEALRLGILIGREPYLSRGGSPPPADDWFWIINAEVSKFRVLRTEMEFFERRAEAMERRQPPPFTVPTSMRAAFLDPEDGATNPQFNSPLLDIDCLHPEIALTVIDHVSARLFSTGVLQAALGFREVLRSHTGIDADGTDLVNKAFEKLRPTGSSRAELNRFEGTKQIALGMMRAYRNNLAHELDQLDDSEAAEAIGTFSMLARNVQRFVNSN
jgi:uncharacterized protein (TIGR02391 family)